MPKNNLTSNSQTPRPNASKGADEQQKKSTSDDKSEGQANFGGGGGGNYLTSPEGILMLTIAIMIDGIGFIIFLLGTWFAIDDYGSLDIFGMITIGGWMYLRSNSLNGAAIKKGFRRFITSSIIELVPFLGGASPSWTWLVYKTLKSG